MNNTRRDDYQTEQSEPIMAMIGAIRRAAGLAASVERHRSQGRAVTGIFVHIFVFFSVLFGVYGVLAAKKLLGQRRVWF